MPKPMLKPQSGNRQTTPALHAQPHVKQNGQTRQAERMQLDRLLRQKRSKTYMDAMHALDAGGHVHNQAQVRQIIDAIREEFPFVEMEGILLGVVSRCYLGDPYEVHSLDITGEIIEHYQRGQAMPGELEKARSLAMHGGYEFVEVYLNCCRAVSSTGEVSVISC